MRPTAILEETAASIIHKALSLSPTHDHQDGEEPSRTCLRLELESS